MMISVIVPVYNSEDYLHVCLNSILKQTYQNFEIICVDDNSTDSSLEILNFFSRKDSRIQIIKNNYHKGTTFCINKGLSMAKGDYISLLDSKDWLSINSFEFLINKIENNLVDAVIFKNAFFNEDNHSFSLHESNLINVENRIFNHYDLEKTSLFKIGLNLYNCCYSKSFLDKLTFDLSCDDDYLIYDILFYKTLIHGKRLFVLNENLGNVREVFPFVKKYVNELSEEIKRQYTIFKIFLENKNIYERYKPYLFKFFIGSNLNKIMHTGEKELFYQFENIFEELILKYGLQEDIWANVDFSLLDQFKFSELINDLEKTFPKVSVIVPVFNVENYLAKCLNSVCNQSFKNIEIICINDGSTDKSKNILDNFAKNDLRISVVNQQNGGPGFARNVGMKLSKGDYILFIDSDDFIEINAVESAYNNMISNGSDLAIFKFSRFTEDNINYSKTGFPLEELFGDINYNMFTFTYEDVKKYVLNASFSAWSKIYKKGFLKKFDSYFQVGIAYEDVLFHIKSLLNASSISFIPEFLYNYRISNSTSIMSNKSHVWDIFDIINSVEDYLKQNNYFYEFKSEFLLFKITQLSQYLDVAASEDYFASVKNEFECLLVKKEYVSYDFEKLFDKPRTMFYCVLNSMNYKEFSKRTENINFDR